MREKPVVTIPRRVEPGRSIKLYPYIHVPFLHLIGALYPKLATYDKATKGYSAFREDGTFIGSFGGRTLASIRKNPLFVDDGQWFLRALLAGLEVDGHHTHVSVCDWDNVGTMRLWQKMGLGVWRNGKGMIQTTGATNASQAELMQRINYARPFYAEHRVFAERQLAKTPKAALDALIPTEATMGCEPAAVLDVTL